MYNIIAAYKSWLILVTDSRLDANSAENIKMNLLVLSVTIALAGLTVVSSQLPCDHVLRHFPAFSYLFIHCDCLYSEWTDWVPIERVVEPECNSNSELIYTRKEIVVFGNCEDITENKTECKFNNEPAIFYILFCR